MASAGDAEGCDLAKDCLVPAGREEMLREVFLLLGGRHGTLSQTRFRLFAVKCGFTGNDASWTEVWRAMCVRFGINPQTGTISQANFDELVNDESAICYRTDDQLILFVKGLSRKPRSQAPAARPPSEGSSASCPDAAEGSMRASPSDDKTSTTGSRPRVASSETVTRVFTAYTATSSSTTAQIVRSNGSVYEGQVDSEGRAHGQGTQRWQNDDRYEGYWAQDRMHGQGKFFQASGSVYAGGWVDGVQHGIGKMNFIDGSKYEGFWEDGLMTGYGKFQWPDGAKYVGQFVRGKKDGGGIMRWEISGVSYDGEWKDDLRHGSGVVQPLGMQGQWDHGELLHWVGPTVTPSSPRPRADTTLDIVGTVRERGADRCTNCVLS